VENPYIELCKGGGGIGLAIGCHFLGWLVPALSLFVLCGGAMITAHSLWRIARGGCCAADEPPDQPE
jgi:hypothetical protein